MVYSELLIVLDSATTIMCQTQTKHVAYCSFATFGTPARVYANSLTRKNRSALRSMFQVDQRLTVRKIKQSLANRFCSRSIFAVVPVFSHSEKRLGFKIKFILFNRP